MQVTAHPQVAPNILKQTVLEDHHPLLRSLTDALDLYEAFPEPYFNTHQPGISEELLEYLDLKFY